MKRTAPRPTLTSGDYFFNQITYDRGYDKGYDEGMSNIARTITGYEQCIVKEIQIGTGRTTKVTISVPDVQSPEGYNTILK